VITLMTTEQVREVHRLTKQAGISARTSRISSADGDVLTRLVPGERTLQEPKHAHAATARPAGPARPARSSSSRHAKPTAHEPGRSRSGPRRRRASRPATARGRTAAPTRAARS
jgi:hypothetical protein